jgi:hypothetical protein
MFDFAVEIESQWGSVPGAEIRPGYFFACFAAAVAKCRRALFAAFGEAAEPSRDSTPACEFHE